MKLVPKVLFASALAVLFALGIAPNAAKADYFTGHWKFSGHSAAEDMAAVCVIAVNSHGDVLGQCTGPFGVAKAEGVTNGEHIVLRVHHEGEHPGDVSGVATLTGVWYGDGVIKGTFVDSPFPGVVGHFTGVPAHS
jgi:hypothetical protein